MGSLWGAPAQVVGRRTWNRSNAGLEGPSRGRRPSPDGGLSDPSPSRPGKPVSPPRVRKLFPMYSCSLFWSCASDSAQSPLRKRGEWEERRRQNIEKMNEEMEKIAEYERNQRDGLQEKNPVRNFLDDPRRSGSFQEADRKEGSRRHVRNWGGPDFDKVKTGMEREKEWHGRRPGPKSGGPLDMTLSMTGRERAEYVRWKKEREQIDQERLARHRKPTGQWCREWDAEKTDTISRAPRLLTPCCPLLSDENKRPPRPPTFGEFLSEHRAERRRKGRGRPAPAKPYSEEEEDEGHLSSSGEEEEAAPPVESPKSPRALKVGRGPAPKLDMPPPGAHGGQGKPLSPFSPAEGYQPVSDWGEEMELNSPRGSVGDSPPQGPGPAPQAQPHSRRSRRGTGDRWR
uniref:Coiled-coil domain containing 9 n=1 Tax=Terrapene triunguis TaxID=2587831 RepID=A0A674J2M6_9SAUR